MKLLLTIVLLVLGMQIHAQKKETYYDYNWKPCDPLLARFYSINEKTDSGWFRRDYYIGELKLQMAALYSDEANKVHNGYSYYFYPDGKLSETGQKIQNKKEGLFFSFHNNGMMKDSGFFHDDKLVGKRFGWHPNGAQSDSIVAVNDSMEIHVSWFDNGVPSSAGYTKYGKDHGKWRYFHNNGKPAALEVYNQGKLVSGEYFDEDGVVQTKPFKDEIPASFKGGMDGWRTYLEKNLYWPHDLHFKDGNMAVTGIEMTISEDGNVENVFVTTPFHPEFDNIALKVIKQSPKWKPAIQNNRRVKYRFRQHVTFQEPDE